MKVIRVSSFGSAEELVEDEVQQAAPRQSQVVIEVEVAGVGLVDVLARRGLFPGSKPGFIPGVEVAGRVIKVGEKVDRKWIGHRVFAIVPMGGYAEEVVADVRALSRVPEQITSSDAVALGVNALVAEFSLQRVSRIEKQKVLIRGAGGGIGSVATQLAALKGGLVTAITSSPEKRQKLENLKIKNFASNLLQITEEYDVIIDPVAGVEVEDFMNVLRPNGHYVINGAAAGFPNETFGSRLISNFQKSLTISCVSLNSIPFGQLSLTAQHLFEMAVRGELKPVVSKIFPLMNASDAHKFLESGNAFGKVLLIIEKP
jgi:NADPH:quinone reductase